MKNFYLGIVLANPFIAVSAGATDSSVPSGQSDPAVTPDLAPADLVAARTDVLQTVVATASASDEPIHSSDGGVESRDGEMSQETRGMEGYSAVPKTSPLGTIAGVAPGPSEADSGAPQQPRGEAAQTNATQPVASPNFESVIKELLQICPPLKPWQTPLRIDVRHQERAVDDAIADFFDPAPMFLQEPLRRAG